jgi:hypothetical protein
MNTNYTNFMRITLEQIREIRAILVNNIFKLN